MTIGEKALNDADDSSDVEDNEGVEFREKDFFKVTFLRPSHNEKADRFDAEKERFSFLLLSINNCN